MQKTTVVLVEDERPALKVFRHMIEQRSDLFELLGEAENGAEGAALIMELKPQIVITDITMPVKSGLEMIRELRHTMVQPPLYILLTCHEDFHFAQEAIELGASSYVLKERCLLDSNLLTHILEGMLPAIMGQSEAKFAQTALQQKIKRNEIQIESNLFLEMVLGQNEQWLHHLEGSGFPTVNGPYAFFWIEFDRKGLRFSIQKTEELKLWQFAAVNVMQEYLQRSGPCRLIALDRGRFLAIVQSSGNVELTGTEIASALVQFLKIRCFVMGVQMGTSPLSEALPWLRKAFREPDLFFYQPLNVAFSHTLDIPLGYTPLPLEARGIWSVRIREALLKQASWKSDELITFTLDEAIRNRWQPQQIKGLFFDALNVLLSSLNRDNDPHINTVEFQEELFSCQTLGSLHEMCSSFTVSLNSLLANGQSVDRTVAAIILEIKAHPEHQYILEDLAESINYSSNYFSQIFKKITSEPFVQFLTRERIERAKVHLITTNLKTFEIAYKVGIPNYRHFNRLFKKTVGCSPTDYREHQGI
ncbi:AraC family transcriptional regulator [Paenibacillus psychroresistens]|uniref:AraC family transcriptional regulator n=1 Tax=Paenibacillus psychroresistens TaxID=1778678 RepID=A0A6B8RSZ4_9BACL|nr:helix-turn-helix domain-containing protein [Paenibacillus psychroresistens]QGQ98436.1 AraC family transcriptional regulator [Paenibacillus psychroresistens]